MDRLPDIEIYGHTALFGVAVLNAVFGLMIVLAFVRDGWTHPWMGRAALTLLVLDALCLALCYAARRIAAETRKRNKEVE